MIREQAPKPGRFSRPALEQCRERGASEEVDQAIRWGEREPARQGRILCRYNFPFDREWQGRRYALKQVAPLVKEEGNEIVVIAVFTFYF